MSNENLNNIGNWKNKLDELTSLPGENMPDKNAAWEKLHARLGEGKSNKKAIWYWAAAACLLIGLMLSVFIINKKEPQLAKTETKQYHQSTKSTDLITKIDKTDLDKIKTALIDNPETVLVSQKNYKINQKVISTETVNKIRLDNTVSSPDLLKESNLIQPVDTSLNIVAVIPPKKRLRVVHINELGDPVETSPNIANNRDFHSFQFQLATQEIYINSSVADSKNSFTIFKTKFSPN